MSKLLTVRDHLLRLAVLGAAMALAVTFGAPLATAAFGDPPVPSAPTVGELTNDGATFDADVDPNEASTRWHFEYRVVGEPDWIAVPEESPEINEPTAVQEQVTGLVAATDYEVRAVAENEFGSVSSAVVPFTTAAAPAPSPHVTNVTDVRATTAGLTGAVDTRGEPGTSWRFEYRRADAATWVALPQPDGSIEGELPAQVGVEVEGLDPETEYVARLVASGPGGSQESAEHTFLTLAEGALPVPAGRAFEQVTPVDKDGVDLIPGYGGVNITAASATGERFAFGSTAAFAGALGADSQYLAERQATSWSTKPLSPPKLTFFPPYFAALDDELSKGVLWSQDPPELAGGTPGLSDLFLRDFESGSYTLLTTEPATGSRFNDPEFSWASRDLGQVAITTRGQHAYVPDAPSFAVYRARPGQPLQLVSIDPSTGEPFGEAGAGAGLSVTRGGHDRSISEDGSRVFFSSPQSHGFTNPALGAQLYVRKDHGEPDAETVHLSAPEPGVDDPSGTWAAWFRGASHDGSKAFFTSCEKLTTDSTADASSGDPGAGQCPGNSEVPTKADLYLYDLDASGGDGDLVDLTTSDPDGAGVTGFVGMSDSGDRAYFAAQGVLASGALRGRQNLYVWEQGAGVRHIATLSDEDQGVFDPAFQMAAQLEARVTPDGRRLAFASRARLAGYDHGGTSQVYLYDAERHGQLECASCGAATASDATISNRVQDLPWRDQIRLGTEPKRNLSADGRRLFFETAQALVAADQNGQADVYEYDAAARRTSLISSGTSPARSVFAGASLDGEDAFFWTREQLVGWDRDTLVDIYDARVGGGLPEPEPEQPPCDLDCQGEPATAPGLPSLGSSDLEGPGNLVPSLRGSFEVRRLTAAQRAKLARGGRIVLRVRVTRPGRVSYTGHARVAGVRTVVAKGARLAPRAGAVELGVRLSRAARHQIARSGRLSVALSVRMSGTPSQRKLTLRLGGGR